MKRLSLLALFSFLLWQPCALLGHESQPGSLEIEQLGPDRYQVTWRAPIYYGKPHPARLELPAEWETVGQPTQRRRASDIVFERTITTGGNSLSRKSVP